MVKKLLGAVVVAGALSVPLAGVAWADTTPTVPPPGPGGVPGEIGGSPGSGAMPNVSSLAKRPGSVPNVVSNLTGGQFGQPGGAVKQELTPGSGQGSGPKP